MVEWKYYASSCTCAGAIVIYSDGKTVHARCAECQGDEYIGRTEIELHARIENNDAASGVPDETAAFEREPVDGDPDF